MLNIHIILEKIGLTAQNRTIKATFSNVELNNSLFLNYFSLEHELNHQLKAELICLATDGFIPLKNLIGCQVAVDVRTDQNQLFRTTGIITGAELGQSDGALILYKMTLEDATSLWRYNRNSRVFMNKSIIDIVKIIFEEWQRKSNLFAKSLKLDLSALKAHYDIRPFTMQVDESDYSFVTRLLRSENINWFVDEADGVITTFDDSIQPQRLKLVDDHNQFKALARREIRYHRSSAVENFDTLVSFIAKRTIQPTAVHLQRWQADYLEQTDWPGSALSHHKHSAYYKNEQLNLEQSWHLSPAWISDLKGQDGATRSNDGQLEKLNANLGKYHNMQAKQFIAQGTVRDAQVGYWFEFLGHPEIDQHGYRDQQFLILKKRSFHQNNLPKDLTETIFKLLEINQWDIGVKEQRQGCQLTLVRRHIPVVPEYNPQLHKPAVYPQHARVVGPEGESIHVDEWGRIKVRFLFSRPEDNVHDGGRGSNENDADSAFVDVLTPWAGEGFGARFLPRVGELVVVDFFNGDADRPFVMGRIHEAKRSPTQFDIKGKLPDTRRLSGIRSNEIDAAGFNQLRFDDTQGQISAQLQSSHAASQINLGQLSHPKETKESHDRGTGFEIRTDEYGAVRGGGGLLLSSYKQSSASGEHMDAEEAKAQLKASQAYSQSLSEIAKKHQTDEIESIEQLKAFSENIQKDIAKFNSALLLLSSPQGIGLSTAGDIHLSADQHINQIANGSVNVSTQKNFIAHAIEKVSLFAVKLGMRLIAAFGKIELHAQTGEMDIIADKVLKIISKKKSIEISAAEEIIFNVKGNYFKLNADGIEQGTNGESKVYAAKHLILGAKTIDYALPQDPYNEMFVLKDPKGNPVAGFAYKIISGDGTVFRGVSNEKGETIRLSSGYAASDLKVYADDDNEADHEEE
ncbi:MAG: type VI secretion system Vgr family protein [Acinetobacter sp.]